MPPDDDKLTRIENRVTHIEAILPTLATKAEMHDMKAELIKWIVGTAIGLGAVGITVMTFVLNNAIPKTAPQQQPPIIINIPASAPATATPSAK